MKATNINIGKYFGLSPEILSQYDNNKKGIEKKRLYEAMKEYFIKNNIDPKVNLENAIKLKNKMGV